MIESTSQRADKANKAFTCSYEFDGSRWGVTIYAATWEEAEMKLKAVGRGKVDGVMVEVISVDPCSYCGK